MLVVLGHIGGKFVQGNFFFPPPEIKTEESSEEAQHEGHDDSRHHTRVERGEFIWKKNLN
jgi:hypothetical protein